MSVAQGHPKQTRPHLGGSDAHGVTSVGVLPP